MGFYFMHFLWQNKIDFNYLQHLPIHKKYVYKFFSVSFMIKLQLWFLLQIKG